MTRPTQQTIILCSAPHTGSSDLCQFLTAAGLGIPREYFNPCYAGRLMARWGLGEHLLSETVISSYIDVLRRKRAKADVFVTELRYWQFEAFLRNRHGDALFKDACVVHLFRPDINAQFASLRSSIAIGQRDYSRQQISRPNPPPETQTVEHAIAQLQSLAAEDAGFRMLFGLLGIRPIFITTEQLISDPEVVVALISRAVNVSINENALKNVIASRSQYLHAADRKLSVNGIRHALKGRAFIKRKLLHRLLTFWRGQDVRRIWLVQFLSNDFRWAWSLRFLLRPIRLREPTAKFSDLRPDMIDLLGPRFDRDSPAPAQRTIILCSAPRTGSTELCRFLTAAGLGIPHEYFSPFPAGRLMTRWSLKEHPLSETSIASYIDMLRRRRANADVFATKLQYWQFDAFLRNRHGDALFKDACVVHLFRSDVVAQFASFRSAIASGHWDYSRRQQVARPRPPPRTVGAAIAQLQSLVAEDAGFRKLFGLLGIRPIFITTEQLFADPEAVVASIARAVNVSINENALKDMIALSSPYTHAAGAKSAMNDIRHALRERAFLK